MAASRILIVDNRDSFTHNLAQLVREAGATCDVVRHDNIDLEEIRRYTGIIFSPGPGLPREFPEMFAILDRYAGRTPILGVCLGHQAIAEYYGARLLNLPKPLHGERRALEIVDHAEPLYTNITNGTRVGLYHSWAVDEATLPDELHISARASGIIMSLRHRTMNIRGVQYHPESYMTECGRQMIADWLVSAASSASSRVARATASSSLRR